MGLLCVSFLLDNFSEQVPFSDGVISAVSSSDSINTLTSLRTTPKNFLLAGRRALSQREPLEMRQLIVGRIDLKDL